MNFSRFNPWTLAEKIAGRPVAEGTRRFFKDSVFLSAANFVPRLMGFVMTPIVTSRAFGIPDADYLTFNVFTNTIVAVCILLSAQAENSVARYYYEDKMDFPDFLGTQFFFTLALSSVMLVQFWLFQKQWAWVFGLDETASILGRPVSLFLLLAFTAVPQIVHQVYFQILLAQKKSRSYFWWNLAKQVIYVVFGIAFLLALPRQTRYLGLVWAFIISTVALAIPFMIHMLKLMRPVFRWEHVRYALRFSLPGLPGAFAHFLLSFADRIFFKHNSESLGGQYSFAYNIGMLILMVSTGIFSAYMPRFYENMRQRRGEANQSLFTRNFKLLLLGATALILVSKPVAVLLGRDPVYWGGLPGVPITITGYLFMFLGQCFGLYIAFRRRFIFLQSVTLLIAAAINVYANYWLQPLFLDRPAVLMRVVAGITMVSYLVQWLLVLLIARVLLKERTIHFKGLLVPFASYLAFAALWSWLGY